MSQEDFQLLGPPALLSTALMYLGTWLKAIPGFKSEWLPLIFPLIGAAIYPFLFKMPDLGDEFLAGPTLPMMTKIIYGFGVGLSSVGMHQAPKQIEKLLSNGKKQIVGEQNVNP